MRLFRKVGNCGVQSRGFHGLKTSYEIENKGLKLITSVAHEQRPLPGR